MTFLVTVITRNLTQVPLVFLLLLSAGVNRIASGSRCGVFGLLIPLLFLLPLLLLLPSLLGGRRAFETLRI